jgi:PIN domain nuclease of toxin-antitoxin system
MKVLLDTHTFLWWITESHQLSRRAISIIEDGSNQLFFSAASGWEIAIKEQIGKLGLLSSGADLQQFLLDELQNNAVSVLPIYLHHALRIYRLPLHHRDPFDRMLIAQSQIEEMPILSLDPLLQQYQVELIW